LLRNILDQSKLCSLTRKTHEPSQTWVELLEGEIEKNIYSIKKKNESSQHGSTCQIYDPSNEIVITP
jgi:hypothetical protein